MSCTVSVAINSYNHAAYVRESIASVLSQSFQDFEIVVTDDASTDGTADVIAQFTDPRIRFERFERNRGISTAMNATTARAGGEFVAILNSDDFALPGRLQTQVAFLRANPGIAAVFGRPRLVGEHGEPVDGYEAFASPFPDGRAPRQAWLRHFFFHRGRGPFDRFYFITGVPRGERRGGHAHIAQAEYLICIQGSVEVHVEAGGDVEIVPLDRPGRSLYLPAGYWRELVEFAPGTVPGPDRVGHDVIDHD